MVPSTRFRIAVLPGDGIGREVTPPCLELLDAAVGRVGGFALAYETLEAGAETYRDTGNALPAATLKACRDADAILLAAMGLPHIRYADGTEIAPQLDLRFEFGLYAGVRPCRAIPGVPRRLADPRADDIDFVLIRESTEGLFASRGKGVVEDDSIARDTLVITREVSERLFDFAFRLGRNRRSAGRRGRVTCVDKSNVFTSFAFFRRIFDERAAAFPDVAADHAYIDATALALVLKPWDFDVLVTENMFGDILSDLGAGLIGGMGYAPSADIGDEHAVFQPAHGSAPDIAGQGKANPTAMFLSAAMMLEWLGERHDAPAATRAGRLVRAAVDRAFAGGELRTCELGGEAGTAEVTRAVLAALDESAVAAVAPVA
jgi:3-isopropylmalate dehydrogenase